MGDTGLFVQMSKEDEHEARDMWLNIPSHTSRASCS